MAYRYMMHVFCNECGVPHPAGIVIESNELLFADQSVADVYDGRDVPPQIVTMQNNTFQCPNTGRAYQQGDNRQTFLVRMLNRVEGQTFTDVDVRLDNHEYVNCVFTRCRMIYGATGAFPNLRDSTIDECEWVLDAAAKLTIQFLMVLHASSDDGAAIVERIFDNVRNPPGRPGRAPGA